MWQITPRADGKVVAVDGMATALEPSAAGLAARGSVHMKTWLRIGIVVLSVLVSSAGFAQEKGAHPAPPPPPANPVHAAPAPAPPPPPPAVPPAPPPPTTHVASVPAMRSTPSVERAAPREGAMPRGAMRDPSLSDPAAAASGPSRGGAHGAA